MRRVVHLIAGARPNFMKVAPLYAALANESGLRPVLVHTGQHYDANMSGDFLRGFGLSEPEHNLAVGGGSHAVQTATVMEAYEQLCMTTRPDWVVVVGDVNSTVACTIAAKKIDLPVAHLEAGLRSFDRSMPEEINRVVTDSLADVLWTPSSDGDANLRNEGVASERIERVGNIMIDAFEMVRPAVDQRQAAVKRGLSEGGYAVVTFHRPSNVDDARQLSYLVDALERLAERLPVIFPVHPRTHSRLKASAFLDRLSKNRRITLEAPLDYLEFMSLVTRSRLVLTDSGGVQEETTYLRIPCLTLRDNTERPVTVSEGSNRLTNFLRLDSDIDAVLAGPERLGHRPKLWDGRTAGRVVESLKRRVRI